MGADRELLELAAKASGFDLFVWGSKGSENYCDLSGPDGNRWNPLTDDGDALRLAVKLRIGIEFDQERSDHACVYACRFISNSNRMFSQLLDGDDTADQNAATRRAIVRAAAAIGKAMP